MKLRLDSVSLRVKRISGWLPIALTLIACTHRPASPSEYRPFFNNIIGTWLAEGYDSYEEWQMNSDSSFSGRSYNIRENDTTVFERLVIAEEDGKVFYEATVAGQNDERPVRFELVIASPEEVVFVNLQHDFPKKIHYRILDQDHMKALVSGREDDKDKTIEINYSRYIKKKKVTGIGESPL